MCVYVFPLDAYTLQSKGLYSHSDKFGFSPNILKGIHLGKIKMSNMTIAIKSNKITKQTKFFLKNPQNS